MKVQSAQLFAVLSAIAAAAAIIAGMTIIGSPNEVRMRRFDEARADDLERISRGVSRYRETHENLPEKLDDLRHSPQIGNFNLQDPEGRPYDYTIKGAFSYQLCAEFDRTSESTVKVRSQSLFEQHEAGRQCFDLEARPLTKR
jgi:hypothetical protein